MKMMGLNDKSYFTGWFIFMFGIINMMSLTLVLTAKDRIFKESDLSLIFMMSVLYGMTLYGFAFQVVAFLPTKKSAGTLASLLHIISFYVAFAFRGPAWGNTFKMVLSLIPNCALAFTVEHLFHCELQGSGLDRTMAAIPYQNFSFVNGCTMLAVDVVVWAILGYYFDQVAPREIGLPRSIWFPCQSRQRKEIVLADMPEECHN
jgi:hypothetical protein